MCFFHQTTKFEVLQNVAELDNKLSSGDDPIKSVLIIICGIYHTELNLLNQFFKAEWNELKLKNWQNQKFFPLQKGDCKFKKNDLENFTSNCLK